MKRLVTVLFLAFVGLSATVAFGSTPAGACSCAMSNDADAFARSHAVFVGEVAGYDAPAPGESFSSADPARWTFTVSRAFKGEVTERQVVVSEVSGASCGLEIPRRGEFLVFAETAPAGLSSEPDSGSSTPACVVAPERRPTAPSIPHSAPGIPPRPHRLRAVRSGTTSWRTARTARWSRSSLRPSSSSRSSWVSYCEPERAEALPTRCRETMGGWDLPLPSSSSCTDETSSSTVSGSRSSRCARRTTTRFATTEYHESLLVLCDADGVDLLGRLSWAMAFQTRPRTILLIDLPLIAPDPFGASPSEPIVIVNSEYEPPSAAALDALRAMLPLTDESLGSVRLMTAGFDRAVADVDHFWNQERANDPELKQHVNARWVERVSGVVVLAAPTPVLRQWAVRLTEVAGAGPRPAGWTPAAEQKWTGEVKVLAALTSPAPS